MKAIVPEGDRGEDQYGGEGKELRRLEEKG